MENELGGGNFIYSEMLKLLMIFQLTVPGFTHLLVHQKKVKIGFTHQWVVHQLSILWFTHSLKLQLF